MWGIPMIYLLQRGATAGFDLGVTRLVAQRDWSSWKQQTWKGSIENFMHRSTSKSLLMCTQVLRTRDLFNLKFLLELVGIPGGYVWPRKAHKRNHQEEYLQKTSQSVSFFASRSAFPRLYSQSPAETAGEGRRVSSRRRGTRDQPCDHLEWPRRENAGSERPEGFNFVLTLPKTWSLPSEALLL